MTRYDQERVTWLTERPRTIYVGEAGHQLWVGFPQSWGQMGNWPLASVKTFSFLEQKAGCKGPWVQAIFSKVRQEPGVLRGREGVVSSHIWTMIDLCPFTMSRLRESGSDCLPTVSPKALKPHVPQDSPHFTATVSMTLLLAVLSQISTWWPRLYIFC